MVRSRVQTLARHWASVQRFFEETEGKEAGQRVADYDRCYCQRDIDDPSS